MIIFLNSNEFLFNKKIKIDLFSKININLLGPHHINWRTQKDISLKKLIFNNPVTENKKNPV